MLLPLLLNNLLTEAPSGNLQGTASVVISSDGALKGVGSLVGASSSMFGGDGTLSAIGYMVGTSTVTHSVSGTIAGIGSMSGLVEVQVTATLDNGFLEIAVVNRLGFMIGIGIGI
jgi:hypothetical protein